MTEYTEWDTGKPCDAFIIVHAWVALKQKGKDPTDVIPMAAKLAVRTEANTYVYADGSTTTFSDVDGKPTITVGYI